MLGILEHASRAALCLEALQSKSSWTLILKLIEAIRRHGKPRAVRTDNEAVFASRTFCLALLLLGIGHQRTDPGCPWQNGRVERLFGTLKAKLDRLAVDSFEALNGALAEFRFYYNHVRSHQHLAGLTPAPSSPSERILVRSLGWAARRLLLTKVTPEPARKKNGALRTARRLSGRNASRSHIDKKFEEGKSYKPKKIGRRHKNSRRSRS